MATPKVILNDKVKGRDVKPEVVFQTVFEYNDQPIHVNARSDGVIILYMVNELRPAHRIHLHLNSSTAGTYDIGYADFEDDLITYIKNNANLDEFTADASAKFVQMAEMIAQREKELKEHGIILDDNGNQEEL